MRLLLAFACWVSIALCACGDDDYGKDLNPAYVPAGPDQSVVLDATTD